MIKVFSYFIENWRVSLTLTAVAILIGSAGFLNLKKESFPSIDTGTIVVDAVYPGASPKEVFFPKYITST